MEQINNLISAEDFILQEYDVLNEWVHNSYRHIINYAQLLKRTLTIDMFVPCDAEGNVLCEPRNPKVSPSAMREYDNYVEAKQQCLFEGFEVSEHSGLIMLKNGTLELACNKERKGKIVIIGTQNMPAPILHTLSDLVKFNLPITQKTKKIIYE